MGKVKVKVAIIGAGNCALSLVQGLAYYRAKANQETTGLVRPDIGGYRIEDVEIVAAFDVAASKVGRDLSEALWAPENRGAYQFAEIPNMGVVVSRGPTLDGLGQYLREYVKESTEPPCDPFLVLTNSGAQVVVNYLPVGSQEATEYYANMAVRAKCAFVNCMPVFIGSDPEWEQTFRKAGLSVIGDDIKSQVGATIVHRVLATLMRDRGVHLDTTFQLNVGGNGDFLNMLERERLATKKRSKTEAVVSVAGVEFGDGDVHIEPAGYIKHLGDKKIAIIRLMGRGFGGAPMSLRVELEVWDSPNSAGIVIDAIRCAKLAMDRGEYGNIRDASAYFMKRPPVQVDDSVALTNLENWLAGTMAKAAE